MKKLYVIIVASFLYQIVLGQEVTVYPTNWWVGMKNPKLQLMLHGDDIAKNSSDVTINYPGVKVQKVHKVENDNYLFVDVIIAATAKPGNVKVNVKKQGTPVTVNFPLQQRRAGKGSEFAQGVTSSDFIYMLMPDRFSNGDPTNDRFPDLRDTALDRKDLLKYHGGDLKGITNHLNYFNELGATTLWLTPVVRNDMPPTKEPSGTLSGYHGYWITDHYEIDKRYGGKQGYIDFIQAAHNKGLKVIQDAVYNHVGSHHWFVLDPPTKDWINTWPSYQGTNHREEAMFDPHGNKDDKKVMEDGWFTPGLPDLNLSNPYLANFMIQNAIWCVEYFGIDGWRVDTYKYCDESFMNNVNAALYNEYPAITIFGEAWVNTVPASAYFCQNTMDIPFKHNLQGVTDFPMTFAMLDAARQNYGWTEGFNRLYMTLSQDMLYKNPMRNCIFLDNHDMDRVYSVVGEDFDKYKMVINWLLTLRGIPQLYYGTEILMKNKKDPYDHMVRFDFPGGFTGDKDNKFMATGRTKKEDEAFNYVKTLANFRKNSSAIKTGKLMQFAPSDSTYIYFRYDDKQTVMVASNSATRKVAFKMERFTERTNGFSKARDVITGKLSDLKDFAIEAKSSGVYELIR